MIRKSNKKTSDWKQYLCILIIWQLYGLEDRRNSLDSCFNQQANSTVLQIYCRPSQWYLKRTERVHIFQSFTVSTSELPCRMTIIIPQTKYINAIGDMV